MTEDKKESDITSQVRNPELIRISLKNIANEIASGISSSDFQRILSTLDNKTSVAKALYNMQTTNIINDIHNNIDNMYNEAEIDDKHNEITKLINNSSTDKNFVAWRPVTGDCDMQLSGYRKRSLIETKKKLQKLLYDERSSQMLLKRALDKKRDNLETLSAQMKKAKLKITEKINEAN